MNEAEGTAERRDGRRRIGRLLAAACLITIGAVAATLVAHGSRRRVAPARAVALQTAIVRRGSLVTVRHYHGELRYPARGSVHLSGSGTVTSLPRPGEILTDGAQVAEVDDQAIGVLFGTTALYRTLGSPNPGSAGLAVRAAAADLLSARSGLSQAESASGATIAHAASVAQAQVTVAQAQARLLAAQGRQRAAGAAQTGPDVTLVAGNMASLGYDHGFTDSWDPALQDAVRLWQERIGAAPTGEIVPADVLVLPGAARVSGVSGGVGAAPSAVTISLSSPLRAATFTVQGAVPAALARGRAVRVSAHGQTVTGRVSGVRRGRSSQTDPTPSARVQVDLPRSSVLARGGTGPVTISVTTGDRSDVLTVPTQALLALASGGYALQLPDGRLIAIRTGIVQGSQIEVSGRGVHPGLRVVSVS